MTGQEGYASLTVFILILFLSSVTLSLLFFLQLSLRQSSFYEEQMARESELEKEVSLLIDILKSDPTGESDSYFDPVWTFLEERKSSAIELRLTDISSRFNLNFMRTKMLEESSFKNLMINGKDPDQLKQCRGENGFFVHPEGGYGLFFRKEDLDKYFTTYSYANFNVTYEDSLKKIFEIRVSEEGSLLFLNKVQQHISEKIMADKESFRGIASLEYKQIYPLVNTEALMNVNFIPEKVLHAVLYYPYGGTVHKNGQFYFNAITSQRDNHELTTSDLDELFELEEEQLRIREYLGTRTWFWKISATTGDVKLEVVLARLPDESIDDPEFQIIEWKFSRLNEVTSNI